MAWGIVFMHVFCQTIVVVVFIEIFHFLYISGFLDLCVETEIQMELGKRKNSKRVGKEDNSCF